MPTLWAVLAMFVGPTSRVSWANTVLSDSAVAVQSDIGPAYEFS